jgi:uncharacterized protein YoxC
MIIYDADINFLKETAALSFMMKQGGHDTAQLSQRLDRLLSHIKEKDKAIKELANALKECATTLEEVDGSASDTEEFIKLADKYLDKL